ncbi:unnamed protein product [Paramecium sonneborni]|uniref:Uncharacterized protein n=1 Tax=Paramecium sonneborni TaxID=65129 RepID=A0A8S1M0S3_9CILI|nr:unnamed protein product [Paramecium sonneborni]
MSNETGINASLPLSNLFLLFIDYKIHEYSPQELYENKARLFESLIAEWNHMNDKEKEKYRQKVKFTNGGEKAKCQKEVSALETLYETAVEQQELISQQVIHEKSQQKDSSENLSSQQIKETQISTKVRPFEEQKQDFQSSLELISEKETNQLYYPVQNESTQIREVLNNEEYHENEQNDKIKVREESIENIKQEQEASEKVNNRQRKKQDPKNKKHSMKGTKRSDQKKALSPTKQIQLQNQKDEKYFSIDQTLTLKQLKDLMKNFF